MDVSFEIPAGRCVVIENARLAHPVARVWTAYAEPLFFQLWWGPHGYVNRSVDISLKAGGTWSVVQSDPEGNTFSFYGRYDRVEPGSLISTTFISELFPDVLTWLRIDLAETPGGTAVATTHRFADEYHRRGYLNLGGVERMRESTERLDALLRTMS